MSSPLDARIRNLAREEAATLLGDQAAGGTPGHEDLQQQITDLHEHLHHAATAITRLEDRLDTLEKAASPAAVAKRAARKPAGSSE